MKNFLTFICLTAAAAVFAVDLHRQDPAVYWDQDLLSVKPTWRQAPFPESQAKGLQAILINGYGPAKGDKKFYSNQPDPLSTKVRAEFFAYMGFPEGPVPEGGFPGVVLIHGGGGTAFPQYAQRWIAQGYAVIILDWYNCRPIPPENATESNVQRTPLEGGKRQDHVANVANMILAHTVLRSQPDVNPEKTIFVGLSWGSWYGAMVAAIDTRFKAGIQIYCGDIKDNDSFINGRFHHAIKVPLYWIVGTNDQNMKLSGISKAFKVCPTVYNRSIVIGLLHSHMGFDFICCQRMAAHFLKGGPNLPHLGDIQVKDGVAFAKILDPGKGIKVGFLCYTDSTDPVYHKRKWKILRADITGDIISAKIPAGAHTYYLSVHDEYSRFNTLCGSTDVVVLENQ